MEPIHPILISAGNAEAVTGMSWRHVRDHAHELGIPIVQIGRKHAVRAADLLAALASRPPAHDARPDPEAAMRRRVFGAGGRP